MRTADFSRLLRIALVFAALAGCLYGGGLTSTLTVVTIGPSPGAVGSNVVVTATIQPQVQPPPPILPTGTVVFSDGVGDMYTIPVQLVAQPGGGFFPEANLIVQLPAGTYTFTATYSGDSLFSGSMGTKAETIEPGSTTTLTVSSNPGIYGAPFTITATVAPIPSGGTSGSLGTVTFYDLAQVLGVAPVGSNGVASLTTNLLSSGLRSLTAHYSPAPADTADLPSTSAILTVGILGERGLGFGPAQTVAAGSGPNTVLTADLNGDGILDTVVINGVSSTISVFLGNNNGTFQGAASYFTYASGNGPNTPVGGVIGDFNGDGIPDIALATGDGVDVLLGDTTTRGTFDAATNVYNVAAAGIALADFDGNGFPDLVVSNAGSFGVTVLLGRGDGKSGVGIGNTPETFTQTGCTSSASGTHPGSVGIGNFTSVGTPDIAVMDDQGVTVILGTLNNTNAGPVFACQEAAGSPYAFGSGSSGLVIKDLTGNNNQDITLTNYNAGTVTVLLGKGDGTFTWKGSFQTDPNPVALASADFNGDGIPDLVVSDGSSTGGMNLFVLLGNGDGTFEAPLGYASDPSLAGLATGAFLQNGEPDIAAVSSSTGNLNVLLNGFATVKATQGATQSVAVYNSFPTLLTVQASGFGSAAGHVPVTFTVVSNAGAGAFFSGAGSSVLVMTNGSGVATAPALTANGTAGSFTVTATAGGNTVTFNLTNTAQTCFFTVAPSTLLFDANGGQANFTVTSLSGNAPGCTWSAASSYPGILVGNPNGTGSGTVNVLIPQNTTGAEQFPTISIAGQTVTVTIQETAQIFADVLPTAYYFDAANVMYQKGITSGCSTVPLDYCPTQTVTRLQMAIFLVRSIFGSNPYTPPSTPYFTDVPTGTFGFNEVQELAYLGITSGCSPQTFCPDDPVTRDQMAAFVIRSRYGKLTQFDYNPGNQYFTDVPPTDQFYPNVQRMKIDNITSGCTVTTYCPTQNVLRQDMAVFIMRGLFNQFLPTAEPVIASISPSTVTSGVPTLVTVTGVNTNFVQNSTLVNPIPGNSNLSSLVVGAVTVTSPTSFTVTLTATLPGAPGGTAAPLAIWVTTPASSNEEAVIPNGLTVVPGGV